MLIAGVVAVLFSGTARAEPASCDEASRINLERILPPGLPMFEMAQILTDMDADDQNNDICRVPIMTSGGPGVLRFQVSRDQGRISLRSLGFTVNRAINRDMQGLAAIEADLEKLLLSRKAGR
jgi:hypothetical protein